MRDFVCIEEIAAEALECNHDGSGPIEFRRLLTHSDFQTPIDFVDYSIVPPGSTIGAHRHIGNEEIYFIVTGKPLIRVDGQERRLKRGDLAVVLSAAVIAAGWISETC